MLLPQATSELYQRGTIKAHKETQFKPIHRKQLKFTTNRKEFGMYRMFNERTQYYEAISANY